MKDKSDWQIVDWDRNRALGLKCWRKRFGRGHVSVGCGDFDLIVFSFGADSDDSYSSTRKRNGVLISEAEAMREVDRKMSMR